MTVGEIVKTFSYGVPYMLVGAASGKRLGTSWTNKADYLKRFFNCDSSGIFPTIRTSKEYTTNTTDYVYPVIAIWVDGE